MPVKKEKIRKKSLPAEKQDKLPGKEAVNVFTIEAFRKEFLVIVIFIFFLILFSVPVIKHLNLAVREEYKVYALVALAVAYFAASNFLRAKQLVRKNFLYAVDVVFFTTVFLTLIIMTGGYESPFRFSLFFLFAIFKPFHGSFKQVVAVMSVVFAIQFLLGYFYFQELSYHLISPIVDGLILMTTALVVKLAIAMYETKAHEYRDMGKELEILYKEAAEYNTRLENVVAERTSELNQTLSSTKDEKNKAEKQRVATLNILEDMADSQRALEQSKTSLEARQLELEAIAEMSGKLSGATEENKAIEIINNYFQKFFNFYSFLIILRDVESKGGFVVKSFINRPVGMSFLSIAKKELADYMLDNGGITKDEIQNIINTKIDFLGKSPSETEDSPDCPGFILSLKTGEKIFGAIYIASADKNIYQVSGKKEIIDAIISTASVALYSLQEIFKSQQSKTETLVKSLSNGIILLNKSMEAVLVNPRATELAGVDKLGNNLDNFLDALGGDRIKRVIDLAFSEKKAETIKEAVVKNKTLEISITPVSDNEGNITGVALIIHDVTEAKVVEQMKSEFVSVASHQLRTPLTAIRLFIEMLMRGDVGELAPAQKEYMNNVYESTDRMVRLVNDLLNVTRIESNRMQVTTEPTQLEELIENVIKEEEPLALMKNCRINFKKPVKKTPLILVDRNLFRQVVQNLIVNAVKYSDPKEGIVKATLALEGGENYLLCVEDNGIGIPEKFKDKIFQKFSRADNAVKANTEGTGLGLYVSHEIVQSFHGKIWFESNKDKGTKFFVLMPATGMKDKTGERGLVIS